MRKSVTSKYVICYCGKKYQYRKSYSKHIEKCKIYQIESDKPFPLVNAITSQQVMEITNQEAKSVLKSLGWKFKK